ncbi:MAG TPA: helix-turn-helix transcriptional regulator [Actinophytocola sp.]|jgi:transcriptional regulator with XRE-family HTH domain|nr:helix-turn-helix transcriptional regulator [Actinophytocola sp.]
MVLGKTADDWRRLELRRFLADRRGRISPGDVGLLAGARRRTSGLRREEVAILAGVSDSWYQWLEQGRAVNVSEQVLDAVAKVLRLDDHERRHLYMLAGASPPRRHTRVRHDVDPVLRRLLDTWMPNPAQILDRHWYVVARNESARLIFGMEDEHFNALVCTFVNPILRADHQVWTEMARTAVAAFRAEMSQHPDDGAFAAIVDELSTISPEFVDMWSEHDVRPLASVNQLFAHPIAGELAYEIGLLRAKTNPDLSVALYFPVPNTETGDRLQSALSACRTPSLG